MYLQAIVLILALVDPNTVGYTYDWYETAIAPTSEVQAAFQQWEDGYIPRWYKLRYPGVAPDVWFRWERILLPTAVEWLKRPSDVNDDGEANLGDYGKVAAFHPGGLKSRPQPVVEPPPSAPPKPTRLEVLAMFMELFMTEADR